MAISDSSLRKDVFKTIRDVLHLGSSTLTPSTSTVTSGYPDFDTITYPVICIMPITPSKDDYTIDTTRSTNTKSIPVVIELFTLRNDQLDTLSDGIDVLLQTPLSGIALMNTQEDYGISTPNSNKVHQKTMTFNFMRR